VAAIVITHSGHEILDTPLPIVEPKSMTL